MNAGYVLFLLSKALLRVRLCTQYTYNTKVSSIWPGHSHNFQITDGIAIRYNSICGQLSKKHYYFQNFIFIL